MVQRSAWPMLQFNNSSAIILQGKHQEGERALEKKMGGKPKLVDDKEGCQRKKEKKKTLRRKSGVFKT